jgi:hypothetical protein
MDRYKTGISRAVFLRIYVFCDRPISRLRIHYFYILYSLNILSLMGSGIHDVENISPTATDIENMLNQVTVMRT